MPETQRALGRRVGGICPVPPLPAVQAVRQMRLIPREGCGNAPNESLRCPRLQTRRGPHGVGYTSARAAGVASPRKGAGAGWRVSWSVEGAAASPSAEVLAWPERLLHGRLLPGPALSVRGDWPSGQKGERKGDTQTLHCFWPLPLLPASPLNRGLGCAAPRVCPQSAGGQLGVWGAPLGAPEACGGKCSLWCVSPAPWLCGRGVPVLGGT